MWDRIEVEANYNMGEKPMGKLWCGLSGILVTEEMGATGLEGGPQR